MKKAHQNRCTGKTRTGKKCSCRPITGSDFCFFHDPRRASERKNAQSAGGRRGRTSAPKRSDWPVELQLATPEDVRQLVSHLISGLLNREIEPRICNSAGYLAQIVLKAVDQVEVENRLAKLEAILDSIK